MNRTLSKELHKKGFFHTWDYRKNVAYEIWYHYKKKKYRVLTVLEHSVCNTGEGLNYLRIKDSYKPEEAEKLGIINIKQSETWANS